MPVRVQPRNRGRPMVNSERPDMVTVKPTDSDQAKMLAHLRLARVFQWPR